MRLRLYRYNGARWVPNKIDANAAMTLRYDAENDPGFRLIRSEFSPTRATFVLDQLIHGVNYALYDYNGIDWFGYVEVSTDASGLHRYDITVDPLTTAWYRGCCNVTTLVSFSSSYGGTFEIDPRRRMKPLIRRAIIKASGDYHTPAVVMVTFNPYLTQQYSVSYDQTPGGYEFWVFQPFHDGTANVNAISNYNRFLRNAAGMAVIEQKYLDTIIATYVLPSSFCPSSTAYTPVMLRSTVSSVSDIFTDGAVSIPTGGDNYVIYAAVGYSSQSSVLRFAKTITFNTYPYRDDPLAYEAPWTITVPFVGSVSFNPKEASLQGYTFVGVQIQANLIGGFWTVQLVKRRNAAANLEALVSMNWTIPFCEEVFSIGTSNSDQKVTSLVASLAGATAAAASGNYGALAAGVINTLSTSANGGMSIMGNNRGTPYRSSVIAETVPTLVIPYYEYDEDNGASYTQRYGYPCYQLLPVNELTGYAQTAHAELAHLGLPTEIVEAAEAALNAGVYIV